MVRINIGKRRLAAERNYHADVLTRPTKGEGGFAYAPRGKIKAVDSIINLHW